VVLWRVGFIRSLIFTAVAAVATIVSAQHAYHHHHHYGSGHIARYGSYSSSGFYVGTPGFSAGVITPYPVGIAAVPYPVVTGYGGGGWYAPPYPVYCYGGYGYGAYGYGRGGYWLPPVSVPAETLYGVGPVRRLMGLDPPLGTPIVNNTTIVAPAPAANVAGGQAGGFGVVANKPIAARPNVRVSNQQTLERGRKQVERGDAAFAAQQYSQALSDYREAARIAPDLADTYFRQAAANLALSRYDEAASAIKFGLQLAPQWVDGGFRFSALYHGNNLSEAAHREALGRAADARPTSDLLFLTGVVLYFSDRPQASEPFFRRAQAVAVGDASHINAFLQAVTRLPAAAAAQPAPAARPNFDDLDPTVTPQGPVEGPNEKKPTPAKAIDTTPRDI
jgi:hypothetical protein